MNSINNNNNNKIQMIKKKKMNKNKKINYKHINIFTIMSQQFLNF